METSGPRWLVLAVRGALLLLGLGACVFALVVAGRTHGGSADLYSCPMHPQVVAASKGDCPICGMALEPTTDQRRVTPAPGPATDASSRPSVTFSLASDVPDVPHHSIRSVQRRRTDRPIRGPGWVESPDVVVAELYLDEAAALTVGDRGTFRPSDASGASVEVSLMKVPAHFAGPFSRVHLHVEGPGGSLQQAQVGGVDLGTRTHDALMVPLPAILESPEGPLVLVASEDGRTFVRRRIQLGRVSGGLAVVEDGLLEHERVVVMDAFFVNAEGETRTDSTAPSPVGAP